MHNLDASSATSCFLQLAKICEKRGIFLCAAGALPRVEWMLRSHHVAFHYDEEVEVKRKCLAKGHFDQPVYGKLILFVTLFGVSERIVLWMTNERMLEKFDSLLLNLFAYTTGLGVL